MLENLPVITDEFMQANRAKTKNYCSIILKFGPNIKMPGVEEIIWEHGRRNFALREMGLLAIVCPINDGTDVCGLGIFDATPEKVKEIMDGDPGVMQGIFTYEIHPVRSFPGDKLP
ncbi:MAG: hypothetical protein JST75_07925 [Bacteroidetes bacterium]|nr:hypothetical protein [Bacteroidota bacterium]